MQSHVRDDDGEDLTDETGLDFLIRLSPRFILDLTFNSTSIGKLNPHDFIHMKSLTSQTQRCYITHIASELLIHCELHKLYCSVFLLDMGYTVDMLQLMKHMEKTLTAHDLPSASVSKCLTSAPSRLKVVSCSNSTEIASVLSSLREIVLEERVCVIICACYSHQQHEKRMMGLVYERLYALSKTSPVAVVYSYSLIADLPEPGYLRKPTAQLLWSPETKTLSIQRTVSDK